MHLTLSFSRSVEKTFTNSGDASLCTLPSTHRESCIKPLSLFSDFSPHSLFQWRLKYDLLNDPKHFGQVTKSHGFFFNFLFGRRLTAYSSSSFTFLLLLDLESHSFSEFNIFRRKSLLLFHLKAPSFCKLINNFRRCAEPVKRK